MTYPILTVEQFGEALIRTGDLDPIYVMVNGAEMSWEQRARWCLAYWCYYHAGVASYASEHEGTAFWDVMAEAAANVTGCPATRDHRWPRGTERRHFRGKASVNSVAWLREKYPDPVRAVRSLAEYRHPGECPLSFDDVTREVKKWPAFGPWIAFKVADMLDACLGYEVDFTGKEDAFFDDPKAGAEIVFRQWMDPDGAAVIHDRAQLVRMVTRDLQHRLSHLRLIGVNREPRTQEIETVLCKYKAHTRGHYPVGKDTREIKHGLGSWLAVSPIARRCYSALDEMIREHAA